MYLIAKFLTGWADANFTIYIEDGEVNNKKCDYAKKNLVNKKSQQVDGASFPGPLHIGTSPLTPVPNAYASGEKHFLLDIQKAPHRIRLFSFLGYSFCCSLTYL